MSGSRKRIKLLGPHGQPMESTHERWKIAICVPSRGTNPSMFTYDLATLVAYSASCLVHNDIADVTLTFQEGTYIHVNRNDLMSLALESGAHYTFWVDDDMRFPRDALIQLLKHNVPVVGANYCTRRMPPAPIAIKHIDPVLGSTRLHTREADTHLERVDAVGFGCVLVKSEVAMEVGYPWFETKDPAEGKESMRVGEDVDFCIKAKAAGFDVFVDHGLSQEVRHIGQFDYSVAHAVAIEEQHGDNQLRDVADGSGELAEQAGRDDSVENQRVHNSGGGDAQP